MAEQALNDEELIALRALLTMAANGQSFMDLPHTNNINGLTMAVVDTDGELKQVAVSKLFPYLEEQLAYGIEFNTEDLTTDRTRVKRIGNLNLHKANTTEGLPIQKLMYGGAWNDKGECTEKFNPKSWLENTRDGSAGQVGVKLPEFYVKETLEPEGSGYKCRILISLYPLVGYETVTSYLEGSYFATVARAVNGVSDNDTNKLCSVVNTSEKYRGGLAGADRDNFTLLGLPRTGLSRLNYRTYAHNRGWGWNGDLYQSHKALFLLYVVEYANFNIQDDYNAILTTEGYKQGGMGASVTNIDGTLWNNISAYQPLIPCGVTDSLGNGSGIVEYTATRTDVASGTTYSKTFNVHRYRGIEMAFFGCIYTWQDYVNLLYTTEIVNGVATGRIKAYVCNDTTLHKNNDDATYNASVPIPTGYEFIGNLPVESGYIKNLMWGKACEIVPKEVNNGATSNNCIGDYYYCNDWLHKDSAGNYDYQSIYTNKTLLGLLAGGIAYDGALAGLACTNASYAPSDTLAHIGSRLVFSFAEYTKATATE